MGTSMPETDAQRQQIEANAIRDFADKVDGMARVGGSPALTDALFTVARFARTHADRVQDGTHVVERVTA